MKIGFIGLGIMGAPMSSNIAGKHDDTVYLNNRTMDKAFALAEKLNNELEGGRKRNVAAVSSQAELARLSDVIITMVPKSEDSEAVYEALLPELGPGKTCIDMSTIDPEVSKRIAGKVKARGARFADAPVVKSRAAAEAGTLGIYVGSDEETFEAILPVLRYMGTNIIRMGDNGAGLIMKICHNALVSQIQNGVNETVAIAEAYGIDPATYARAISYGGGQNAYLDNHVEMLQKREYPAAFSLRNAAKDVGIALEVAGRCGVSVPGEENAAEVYKKALAEGLGESDWGATAEIIRKKKSGETV